MKAAFAVMLAVIVACLMASGWAQNTGGFQNVGGDWGRSALSGLNINAENATRQSAQNNSSGSNGLWNWGNAPKGSLLVDGKLVDDPLNTLNSLNYTDGSIKQIGVDTFTGVAIYSYTIPKTGEVKYFYIDSLTREPVYTDSPNIAGAANASSPARTGEQAYSLPPVFR